MILDVIEGNEEKYVHAAVTRNTLGNPIMGMDLVDIQGMKRELRKRKAWLRSKREDNKMQSEKQKKRKKKKYLLCFK